MGRDLGKLWAVEHSKRQGVFHIERLDKVLEKNSRLYMEDVNADRDFVPLAIVGNQEEASKLVDQLKVERAKRQSQGSS